MHYFLIEILIDITFVNVTEEIIEISGDGSGEGSGMDDSTSEEHVDVKTGSVGRWARIPKSTL